MSWSLIDKPKTIRVTKSIAREFAEMDSCPGDRPLSERRLNIYRKMFKEGLFRPVTWAKCYCNETGTTYRINGKHTSILISSLEEIPEFYVTIESYEVQTLEDASRLYSTFDSRIGSRTSSDINRSFASSVPELKDVPSRFFSTAVFGIGYAKWQESYYTKTATERAEVLLDEVDFVVWASSMVSGDGSRRAKHINRGPVVAAMFQTWNKSHRDAATFWAAVRNETGEKPSMPDRTLARYLLTTGVDSGLGAGRVASKKADRRTFFVKCLHAWNAWRRGQTTDLKYMASSKVPSVV